MELMALKTRTMISLSRNEVAGEPEHASPAVH
jgi:hypothetical protein